MGKIAKVKESSSSSTSSNGFSTAIKLLASRPTPTTAEATPESKRALKKAEKKLKQKEKKKLKKLKSKVKEAEGEGVGDEGKKEAVAVPILKKSKKRRGRGRGNVQGMDDDTFFRSPFGKKFIKTYQEEHEFIKSVMNQLPHTMLREENGESDELVDIFLSEDQGRKQTEEKEKEFLSRWTENGDKPSRTTDQDELRERLHAKISEIRQAKLDLINPDKKKKKKKQKVEDSDEPQSKKSQFISKANPNANAQSKKLGGTIGNTPSASETNGTSEKTPLRKKSVVKSDGQVVYSKFDFIAADKHHTHKGKPKSTDLLKSVEKHENKISRLESLGKKAEAIKVAEGQRWVSAIRRAQGYKVRDDPTLLKRTIRKEEHIKKASTKKWKERTEKVIKDKEAKQQKRLGNIQGRKDENKKRNQKLLRKRGRIA